MKRFLFYIVLVFIAVAATCSQESETALTADAGTAVVTSDDDAKWQRYPFETAIVEMTRITTNPQFEMEERIKLIIRKHGLEEARLVEETRNIKMLNMVEKSSYRTIMTKEWLTTIKDGKVTVVKNPGEDLMNSLADKTQEEIKSFTQGVEGAMNTTKENLGTKNVAGHDCDLVKITSEIGGVKTIVTQCLYQMLSLETKSSNMGVEFVETVTSLQLNPSDLPSQHFAIPQDSPVDTLRMGY